LSNHHAGPLFYRPVELLPLRGLSDDSATGPLATIGHRRNSSSVQASRRLLVGLSLLAIDAGRGAKPHIRAITSPTVDLRIRRPAEYHDSPANGWTVACSNWRS